MSQTVANKVKDLKKELKQIESYKNGSKKEKQKFIDTQLEYAWEVGLNKNRLSRRMTAEAFELAKTIRYKKGQAYALRNLAYYDLLSGLLEACFESAAASQLLFEQFEDPAGYATLVDILALFYRGIGDYDKAIELTQEAKTLNEKLGFTRGVAWSYHNLGWVYSELGDNKKALDFYKQAVELFERIDHKIGLSRAYTRMGVCCFALNKLAAARRYHTQSLELAYLTETPLSVASALAELAWLEHLEGKSDQAALTFKKSLKYLDQQDNKEMRIYVYMRLGEMALSQNKTKPGKRYLDNALRITNEHKLFVNQHRIHELLAGLYESRGDLVKALVHTKERYKSRERAFNEQNQLKLRNLEIRNKAEHAQQQAEIHRLKNVELRKERRKTDKLLHNILPKTIATELKNKGSIEPRLFSNASVLFTDFVGFTELTEKMTPTDLVEALDKCFSYFDVATERYGLEKLKTIGDSYMAVAGAPIENHTHAIDCILAALEFQGFMQEMYGLYQMAGKDYWQMRIGIHSGPLVAGVIGQKKFAYDVWGDTVNTSSRMESNGVTGEINISAATYKQAKEFFICKPRGRLPVKGKAPMGMYLVNGLKVKYRRSKNDAATPNTLFKNEYEKLAAPRRRKKRAG